MDDFMLGTHDLAQFLKQDRKSLHLELKEKNINPVISGGRLYLYPKDVRRYLTSCDYHYPERQIVSVQMLKGGVGKTTAVVNIAIRASQFGLKVLCIDLDQQANLSLAFNQKSEERAVWVDVVEDKATVAETVMAISPTLHLIPSNLNNSVLDKTLTTGGRNIGKAVSKYLNQIKDQYDLILIDTGPSLGAVNPAAACAADLVLLPINPDKFSMSGLKKTMEELEFVASEFLERTIPVKILFSRFDGRESSAHQLLQQCYQEFTEQMMHNYIRTSSELKNSIMQGRSIFNRRSTAKEDFDLVTHELIALNQRHDHQSAQIETRID